MEGVSSVVTKREIKLWLKRTKQFLHAWQHEIGPKAVNLDLWCQRQDYVTTERGITNGVTWGNRKACGAVGCVGGWAGIFFNKPLLPDIQRHLGLCPEQLPDERLFRSRSNYGKSEYLEGKERLQRRVKYLEQQLAAQT